MQPIQADLVVLLVEDDEIDREIVSAFLTRHNIEVVEAADVASGLAKFAEREVDLVIADVNLPDGSGLDLVRELRAQRDCGVIFLSGQDGADDKAQGLEGGGDDYIGKPVDERELIARVRAVLRRYRREVKPHLPPTGNSLMVLSNWTLDLVRRELADPSGTPVPLTRAEFDVFAALVYAGGLPLSRDYLLEVVASSETRTKERTIDVLVSRIRRKLGGSSGPKLKILTEQGQGYRFAAPIE